MTYTSLSDIDLSPELVMAYEQRGESPATLSSEVNHFLYRNSRMKRDFLFLLYSGINLFFEGCEEAQALIIPLERRYSVDNIISVMVDSGCVGATRETVDKIMLGTRTTCYSRLKFGVPRAVLGECSEGVHTHRNSRGKMMYQSLVSEESTHEWQYVEYNGAHQPYGDFRRVVTSWLGDQDGPEILSNAGLLASSFSPGKHRDFPDSFLMITRRERNVYKHMSNDGITVLQTMRVDDFGRRVHESLDVYDDQAMEAPPAEPIMATNTRIEGIHDRFGHIPHVEEVRELAGDMPEGMDAQQVTGIGGGLTAHTHGPEETVGWTTATTGRTFRIGDMPAHNHGANIAFRTETRPAAELNEVNRVLGVFETVAAEIRQDANPRTLADLIQMTAQEAALNEAGEAQQAEGRNE